MTGLRTTLNFATALYLRWGAIAYYGYVRRDPMALINLRAGRDDPYRQYERLRARGPLSRTRLGNWVTPSYQLCNAVLRSRQFGVQSGERVAAQSDEFDMSFLDRDPPDHTRLRRLAQPAFAAPLPIAVITDLLGVPDADAEEFAGVGTVIGSALNGIRSMSHAARLKAANDQLRELFEGLFELRRREPADDVISKIVAAEGDQISPGEMRPMCTLLLVAGFETTVNLIGNAVNALLDHPAQWADLCADPAGLAAAAIEETLRWDPPVQRTARCAGEDLSLEGHEVRRGEFVVTALAAANRDPSVFSRADQFDIHRKPEADHLAFSGGIHYCVGAPLARMEATIGLQRLAERLPGLTRAGALQRRASGIVRGPLHFPVRAGKSPVAAR